MEPSITRVQTAIARLREGKMIILTDDIKRENEGDLVFAAEDVTAEKINFMVRYARGLVCLSLAPHLIERLQLPMMTDPHKRQASKETAFTVSIEARTGVSTGISAADRARTIAVAIDDATTPEDIVVPGHIFPLKARPGGVLERAGHTEGSVDLAKLAGKKPAAVICEIMNDDGSMARLPDLQLLSQSFDVPLVSIEDLITYRLLNDSLVRMVGKRPYHTSRGTFLGVWFQSLVDNTMHFALVKGHDFGAQPVHVRVHKQQPLEDVLGNNRSTIDYGLQLLAEQERAVVIYLTQANQKAALQNSLNEKSLMMDPRYYGIGAQILKLLGVQRMYLHLQSKRQLIGLAGFGLQIVETILMPPPLSSNRK